MARRATALAVVLIGAVGCGSGAETSAEGSTTASSTTTTECSTEADSTRVPAVVIRESIPEGTTAEEAIDAGWLVEDEIEWSYRPSTAIESLDDMAGGVAIQDLPAHQLATTPQWGLPTDMTVAPSPVPVCPR